MLPNNIHIVGRTLQVALACLLLGPAIPARAQFGGLGKFGKKIQDLSKSKQAEEARKALNAWKPISTEEERDIGHEVALKMVGFYRMYSNEEMTRYVNLVGATVAAHSGSQNIQYHFAILDSPSINAFSAPGGYIFVTRGLLAMCDDESELAGVLAHEVGHVVGRHVINDVIEPERRKQWGMEEASAHVPGTSAYADHIKKLAVSFIAALFTPLPAKDEYDADERGVRYAHAAGYPADGLERLLVKLGKQTNQDTSITCTHPPVADRNARIQQLIASNNWQDNEGHKLADRFVQETAVLRSKPQT